MRKITSIALSLLSIQICNAQSALFAIFESSNSNTKPAESQNSTKNSKSTPPNSKTQSLEQMLKIQQQQTTDLISAAQAATKAASQASIAANNLALKIQLLIRTQESTQQILQKKLNSIPQ